MIVEKVNISANEAFDDRAYSLINKSTTSSDSEKAVRLKFVDRIQCEDLCYSKLRQHGLNVSVQTNRRLNNEVADYIEGFFK